MAITRYYANFSNWSHRLCQDELASQTAVNIESTLGQFDRRNYPRRHLFRRSGRHLNWKYKQKHTIIVQNLRSTRKEHISLY
jgi:hypothetical protein